MIVKLTSNEQALNNLVNVLDDEFFALSDREILDETRAFSGSVASTVSTVDQIVAEAFQEWEDFGQAESQVSVDSELDDDDSTLNDHVEPDFCEYTASSPPSAVMAASITYFDSMPLIDKKRDARHKRGRFLPYMSYAALGLTLIFGVVQFGVPALSQFAKATFKSTYKWQRVAIGPTFSERWQASLVPKNGEWDTAIDTSKEFSTICHASASSVFTFKGGFDRVCNASPASNVASKELAQPKLATREPTKIQSEKPRSLSGAVSSFFAWTHRIRPSAS
jgi:hypothetical protein